MGCNVLRDTRNFYTCQVLYLHMRLQKPQMISGGVSYEQEYTVSSWASEEPVLGTEECPDGCSYDCSLDGCVDLTQDVVTDRVIQCGSNEQWVYLWVRKAYVIRVEHQRRYD